MFLRSRSLRLEKLQSFTEYLGSIISDQDAKPITVNKIDHALAALIQLQVIWRDNWRHYFEIQNQTQAHESPGHLNFPLALRMWIINPE